jgi:hypothetical protein
VDAAGARAPVLSPDAYHLETARELCTLIALAAVAGLAGAHFERRLRAFLFAFGAWDIVYYIALGVLSGYPRLTDEDILFLIPVPWTAPVWAVLAFAAALMLLGLRGVARRRVPLLLAGLLLGWLSFVYEPVIALLVRHAPVAAQTALPSRPYPIWLFLPALVLIVLALPSPATSTDGSMSSASRRAGV